MRDSGINNASRMVMTVGNGLFNSPEVAKRIAKQQEQLRLDELKKKQKKKKQKEVAKKEETASEQETEKAEYPEVEKGYGQSIQPKQEGESTYANGVYLGSRDYTKLQEAIVLTEVLGSPVSKKRRNGMRRR